MSPISKVLSNNRELIWLNISLENSLTILFQ